MTFTPTGLTALQNRWKTNPTSKVEAKLVTTVTTHLGGATPGTITNAATIGNLGMARMAKIGAGYFATRLFPIRNETTLEDFFVNRFGWELYRTFFKDYTEKVWGVPCAEIEAAWGAQRIKGLSVINALRHALVNRLGIGHDEPTRHTSLIEQFLYPRLGPGQMWQEVAKRVLAGGGAALYVLIALYLEIARRVPALRERFLTMMRLNRHEPDQTTPVSSWITPGETQEEKP